jgi:Helicase HerA, central domain
MSYAKALLAQARPQMLAARAKDILTAEVSKGCTAALSTEPVPLEPPYYPLGRSDWCEISPQDQELRPHVLLPEDCIRHQVWVGPDHPFDWTRAELFLKQLQVLRHRSALELAGNTSGIVMTISCAEDDEPVLASAFRGQFQHCELSCLDEPLDVFSRLNWEDVALFDFHPPPPYSHLLTRPDEIRFTPYESLLTAMAALPPPAYGFHQVLFQPVAPTHNWHRNVELLQDLEYSQKLWTAPQPAQRYAQQAPSGDLSQMAWEVETKAHRDKPFFSAAVRMAVVGAGKEGRASLMAMASCMAVFQHGGRPLEALTETDYSLVSPALGLRHICEHQLTYRPGFLVNSQELTGLVHVPSGQLTDDRSLPINTIVPARLRPTCVADGVRVGTCDCAGESIPVTLASAQRKCHLHVIGKPGVGKSTLMESVILQDIEAGAGVVVLDPHGDLVRRLLVLIPEEHADRCIYFNPGDREWVPLWNPLARSEGQETGRTADDLVAVLKSIVTGWGDRLEHLLRHAFFALLQRPGSTLLDVANLLRNKSEESKRLQTEICGLTDNPLARQFWRSEFAGYRRDDLAPAQHKLSKLLVSDTVSLMLSQPESRIDLGEIMAKRQVLLADLSAVGSQTRDVLGGFLLSLLHQTALSRAEMAVEERLPFYIHCDEAPRFVTDALEDVLVEARKFEVGLTLAHQYLSQFSRSQVDAICSVGSTLIMKVDARDARFLLKDLMGKATIEDLTTLEPREVIARMGGEVVRFRTDPRRDVQERNSRDLIIRNTHDRYCRPAAEVRRELCSGEGNVPCFYSSPVGSEGEEEFEYEEFLP